MVKSEVSVIVFLFCFSNAALISRMDQNPDDKAGVDGTLYYYAQS